MMIIEKIKVNDIEKIYELGSRVEEFEFDKKIVSFLPLKVLKKVVVSSNAICFKCEENGEIIGFIIASYLPDFETSKIEYIYVKENYRNHGIGRKLALKVIDILKEKGCSYLSCLTSKAVEEFLYWGFSCGNSFNCMSLCLNDDFKK